MKFLKRNSMKKEYYLRLLHFLAGISVGYFIFSSLAV